MYFLGPLLQDYLVRCLRHYCSGSTNAFQLASTGGILCAEELALVQRQWIGLYSIFSNVEALEQLPEESEAFEEVDGFWRAYLRRIRSEQANIIAVVEEEGLFEILADKNRILTAVQRKLEVL